MTQTRGLPPASIKSTGGAVREILVEVVEQALRAAFGVETAPATLIDRLMAVLSIRVVEVDCPPLSTRTAEAEINSARKAAADLVAALQSPSMQDLLLEMQFVPTPIADQATLYAWLGRLVHLDGYLEKQGASDGYDATYRTLAVILRENGYAVKKTGGQAFLVFLDTLEAAYPGLIFSQSGVSTGQAKKVLRALKKL